MSLKYLHSALHMLCMSVLYRVRGKSFPSLSFIRGFRKVGLKICSVFSFLKKKLDLKMQSIFVLVITIKFYNRKLLMLQQTGTSRVSTVERALSLLSLQAQTGNALNLSGKIDYLKLSERKPVQVISIEELLDANNDTLSRIMAS